MTPCTFCSANRAKIRKCLCPPAKWLPRCASCAEAHGCDTSHVNVKEWKKANAPEGDLTSAVIVALNGLPDVKVWQAKKRGGAQTDKLPGVPDVIGYGPRAVMLAIETKGSHTGSCNCESCKKQRAWGAALVAKGGIFIPNVRSVAEALARTAEAIAAKGEAA